MRLRALETDPDAFGSTAERERARPAAWWPIWAKDSEEGTTQRTFVLDDGSGAFAGLTLVLLDGEDAGVAELYAMWVAPEARGAGAVEALCDAAARWAAQRGSPALRLSVFAGNVLARRAYARAGFTDVGQADEAPDGRAEEQVRMERALL